MTVTEIGCKPIRSACDVVQLHITLKDQSVMFYGGGQKQFACDAIQMQSPLYSVRQVKNLWHSYHELLLLFTCGWWNTFSFLVSASGDISIPSPACDLPIGPECSSEHGKHQTAPDQHHTWLSERRSHNSSDPIPHWLPILMHPIVCLLQWQRSRCKKKGLFISKPNLEFATDVRVQGGMSVHQMLKRSAKY